MQRWRLRFSGWLPIVLAGVVMALLVVLAWQGVDASRSHRAVAEAVVHDYLSYAGERLGDRVRAAAAEALQVLACADSGQRALVAATVVAADREAPQCSALRPSAVFIRSDAGEGLQILAGALDEAVVAGLDRWLGDSPCEREPSCIGVPSVAPPLVVLAQRVADAGGPRVVGFVMTGGEFGRLVDGLADPAALLPRALASKGDRLGPGWLRVATIRSGDTVLHARPAVDAPLRTVAARLGGEGEDLAVEIGLRADAAAALVIGGLPSSRLPAIFTLLAVSLALGGGAVWQVRREQRLARRRSELIAHVSHEIRTPVAQIRLFAETLRHGRVRSGHEAARSLDIIDEEAGRLAGLVDNLLQFTRSGDTRRPLSPAAVSLAGFFAATVERFGPLAGVKDAEIRVSVDPPATEAWVDPTALGHIVFNLLDNAVKYGPAGEGIELGASQRSGSVRIWVRDRGPGIPARDAESVWEPFTRLSRGVEHRVPGTGVGLAIVRDLVRRQGGRAWIEHPPDGGLRVVFELPAATASRRASA